MFLLSRSVKKYIGLNVPLTLNVVGLSIIFDIVSSIFFAASIKCVLNICHLLMSLFFSFSYFPLNVLNKLLISCL